MSPMTEIGVLLATASSTAGDPPLIEWVKVIAQAVTAIVVVIIGFWLNRKLERQKADLTKSVQQGLEDDRAQRTKELEHLRRDLQDTLAQRARRADYLRAQITNLYGPLAFLTEMSARCLGVGNAIAHLSQEYFDKFGLRKTANLEEDEADQIITTENRYADVVAENNREAIKLLRTGWGWLDDDDIEITGKYLEDVTRRSVEFEELKKKRLPVSFYISGELKNTLESPFLIRPDFVERVGRKLREKQAELSGLTGAATQGE